MDIAGDASFPCSVPLPTWFLPERVFFFLRCGQVTQPSLELCADAAGPGW